MDVTQILVKGVDPRPRETDIPEAPFCLGLHQSRADSVRTRGDSRVSNFGTVYFTPHR